MYLAPLLLLSALGVSAHPSGHAHLHRHPNRAAGDVIHATINGKPVEWTEGASPFVKVGKPNQDSSATPTPTPATTTKAAESPKASQTGSTGSAGEGVTTFTTFSDACKAKRATLGQIAYAGNTGTELGAYGCNMLLVGNSDTAAKYDNTARFFGASEDMDCLVWNKIGPDGGINGFWGNGALTFTLKAGGEQYVAFDANSQGGAACFGVSTGVQKTSIGQISGTWLEHDFENSSNNGYSGADASCIVAETFGMTIPGLKVTGADQFSTIYPGGASDNAYQAKDVDVDGLGIKVKGPLKLDVNVGFTG